MKYPLTLLLLLLSLSAYSQGSTFVRKPKTTTVPKQPVTFAIPKAPVAKQNSANTQRQRTNTGAKAYQPRYVYPEGYHTLSGTFYNARYSSPIEIRFYSDGTRLSDCEYYNLRADDGACSMDITEKANGALFLSGYDNEGTYFTISLSRSGCTYKGTAQIGPLKVSVSLTEDKE